MLNKFKLLNSISEREFENFGNYKDIFELSLSTLISETANMIIPLNELYPLPIENNEINYHNYKPKIKETRPSIILKQYKATINKVLNNGQFQMELGPISPVIHPQIRLWYCQLGELYQRVLRKHKESIDESRKIIRTIINYLRIFP